MDQSIRDRAEAILRERNEHRGDDAQFDMAATLHELRVHQIELELQNNELIDAQESLRATQQKYFDLYNFAPVGYFTLDTRGVIIEANIVGSRLLNRDRVHLQDKPMITFLQTASHAAFVTHLDRVFVARVQDQRELVLRSGVHVTVESVLAEDREHCRLIMTDISERKEAEKQALALALERERVGLITQFVKDSTHEFRTPLSELSLQAYMLLRSDDGERRQRSYERITTEIHRVVHLLDAMLEITRLDQRLPLKYQPLNVNQILRDILNQVQEQVDARDQRVLLSLEGDLPEIRGAQMELHRALLELVRNAVIFTPKGGRIQVRTRTMMESILVEVADNGIGIAPEHQEKVFHEFFRIDPARTNRGLGLGLSIARRVVQLHNGYIQMESQVDEGTTFRVILPRNTL